MVFLGHRISTWVKIQGMYLLAAILMISLPFVTHYIKIDAAAEKYWTVFTILFIYSPIGGIVQGTTFSLAGPLPSPYVGAIMIGNGLSGIGSTLFSLLLVAVLPGSENLFTQAVILFGSTTLILLVSASMYPFVVNSEFYRFYSNLDIVDQYSDKVTENDEDEFKAANIDNT